MEESRECVLHGIQTGGLTPSASFRAPAGFVPNPRILTTFRVLDAAIGPARLSGKILARANLNHPASPLAASYMLPTPLDSICLHESPPNGARMVGKEIVLLGPWHQTCDVLLDGQAEMVALVEGQNLNLHDV
ncbi:hypothetical protein ANO11243_058030 [Dothideomycetidae sp. 11243]|nr:hypothetical protein ANO11243_058030 [fungal sp. No.11243]